MIENPLANPPRVGAVAGVGQRVIAYLVDAVVIFAIYLILGRVSGLVANVAAIGYILTRDSLPFLDGQSIGKKLMKLRAVSEDGKSLSGDWNKGILRNVLLVIPVMPLVELIVLLVNNGKPNAGRRLGDQIAKTKVVVTG